MKKSKSKKKMDTFEGTTSPQDEEEMQGFYALREEPANSQASSWQGAGAESGMRQRHTCRNARSGKTLHCLSS